MRAGPSSASARSSWFVSSSAVVARVAGTPMPFASDTKSRSGLRDVEHRPRLRPAGLGAHAAELHVQHRVAAVVGDHRRRRRAARAPSSTAPGACTSREPSACEAQHLAVGARDGRADRQRQADADRAAGQAQPVVARPARGHAGDVQPRRVGLVDDDRVLGQQRADRRAEGLGGQRARRPVRPARQRRLDALRARRARRPAPSARRSGPRHPTPARGSRSRRARAPIALSG